MSTAYIDAMEAQKAPRELTTANIIRESRRRSSAAMARKWSGGIKAASPTSVAPAIARAMRRRVKRLM